MSVDFLKEFFMCWKQLPNGEWIAVQKFIFTYGLLTKVEEYGYSGRYCYENFSEAAAACATWNGEGDPPGNWIKYKGVGGERLGPGVK